MRLMAWASVTAPWHLGWGIRHFAAMEHYTVISRKHPLTVAIESPETQRVFRLLAAACCSPRHKPSLSLWLKNNSKFTSFQRLKITLLPAGTFDSGT